MATLRMVMARVEDVTGWLKVFARVGWSSGLIGHASAEGIAVGARLLLKGKAGISTALRVRAVSDGDRPAFVFAGKTLTYAEVDRRVDRLTAGLQAMGLGPRDAVALLLKNRPEFFELEGAMARLGGSAVSVSWRSTPDELRYLLDHSGAKAVCFEPELWGALEAALPHLSRLDRARCIAMGDPSLAPAGTTPFTKLLEARGAATEVESGEDGAVVIYTSGTTGKPKGAVRRFGVGQVLGFMGFLERVPFARDDRHLCVCPLYHSTALGFAGLTLLVGGCVVIEREFDPLAILRVIERERITTAALVPTMLHRLMALSDEALAAHRTSSLRAIVCVGAQLPPTLARRTLERLGPVLYNLYGATETGLVSVATPADLAIDPSTVGRALHGVEVRLLDESGAEVGVGEVGEFFTRSSMLVAGYHADETATQSSMRDGFFSVGDLARRDEAGRLYIVGRRRDMVISGGVNVYPVEVEAVIDAHPAVSQSAVVGVPDEEWGERLRAFVVVREGEAVEAAALQAHCKARLSGAKVPREWVFTATLPSNATGKILKRELSSYAGPVERV